MDFIIEQKKGQSTNLSVSKSSQRFFVRKNCLINSLEGWTRVNSILSVHNQMNHFDPLQIELKTQIMPMTKHSEKSEGFIKRRVRQILLLSYLMPLSMTLFGLNTKV